LIFVEAMQCYFSSLLQSNFNVLQRIYVIIVCSQRHSVINHGVRPITLLTDIDISFALFNLFKYFLMHFGGYQVSLSIKKKFWRCIKQNKRYIYIYRYYQDEWYISQWFITPPCLWLYSSWSSFGREGLVKNQKAGI
jgi:hypothetical protein